MRRPLAAVCLLLVGLVGGTARADTGSRLTLAQAQQVVNEHNRARREAGVAVMVRWDNAIAQFAQAWADHLASTGVAQHRQGSPYGENIFWGSSHYGVVDAARSWESEESLYHGEAINASNYQIFGHYTQMIWDRTTRIGCGMATSASGIVYIVCNYSPRGNVIGQRPITGASSGSGGAGSSGSGGQPSRGSGQPSGASGGGGSGSPGSGWQPPGSGWQPPGSAGSGGGSSAGGSGQASGGGQVSGNRTNPWDWFQPNSQSGRSWPFDNRSDSRSREASDPFRNLWQGRSEDRSPGHRNSWQSGPGSRRHSRSINLGHHEHRARWSHQGPEGEPEGWPRAESDEEGRRDRHENSRRHRGH
jgi:pathogenesis-related protein 1